MRRVKECTVHYDTVSMSYILTVDFDNNMMAQWPFKEHWDKKLMMTAMANVVKSINHICDEGNDLQ